MSKNWKKKFKNKNKKMNEFREDIKPEKKEMLEVVEEKKQAEPKTIEVKEYQNKFESVRAYRLLENSTIHCADGKKLLGQAGDFYVQLDKVQEFVLPEEIFRKLFKLKLEL